MENRFLIRGFLTGLQPRLRFALANPQPVPLLAGLLVVIAASVQMFVMPGLESAIEENRKALSMIERSTRHGLIERQDLQSSPADTRQQLLGHFPVESELNGQLGQLLDLATRMELRIPSGDYRLVKGKEDALFDRYVLNLPVRGSYPDVRRYLRAVRSAYPGLAIEDIVVRRDGIGATDVEAQLRFVLFCRRERGAASPAAEKKS